MDKLLATCDFSIETSSEDVIKQNAAETGVTDLDWDKVNEDMQIVESAMLKWLDTMFGSARDEGHGSDDSLIGTLFIYRNLDIVKDSLDIGEPLRTGSGTLQIPEMNLTYPELIDISVDFFDLVEEKVDASKKVKSAESYKYSVPFSFTGKVSNEDYSQHTHKHLQGNLGSSYAGDIADISVEVSGQPDEDGFHSVTGDALYKASFDFELSREDIESNILEIISENSSADWGVVVGFTIQNVSEEALNSVSVDASKKGTSNTSELEKLDFDLIDPKTGVNYVIDFIGNYGDFLTVGEDGDYYFKNKDDYIWWKSAVDRQNRIDEFIFDCEDEAIIQDIYDAAEGEVDLDILLDKQIAVIDAATKDNFGVESMRRNASAWSKEQADEVAELDAEFDAFLASEGIDPNSKEASDAWKEGYQDRMKKIFASKSVTSAKEMGVEVIVDDDQEPNDRFIEVTDMLQARYDSMKSENPDLDTADFDAELGTVALEIADEIGARLSVKDGRYIFDFTTEPAPLVKLPEPSEDSFKDEDFEDVF